MTSERSTIDLQALDAYLAKLDFAIGQAVTESPHHQGEVGLFYPNYPALPKALIIKRAKGKGWRGWLSQKTLHREYLAYQRLADVAGVPQCYGFYQKQYLVLQYIEGQPLEANAPSTEGLDDLLATIQAMHQRGVAHGDLKRKNNLLMTLRGEVKVIDLGTAVMKKRGFHPINHWLFRFLAQTDLNAWIKHKYGGYQGVSSEDQRLLKRSWLERGLSQWRSRKRAKPSARDTNGR